MDAEIALLLTMDGIANGAIYVLIALGTVLIFSVTRVMFVPFGDIASVSALTLAMLQGGQLPGTVWLVALLAALATALELGHLVRAGKFAQAPRAILGYGLLPAVFKSKWGTNETLFTLMLNYIAIKFIMFLQYQPAWKISGTSFPKIKEFSAAARLPQVLGVHVGWIIALVLAVLDARQDLPSGGPITHELVSDRHARHVLEPLEQPTEELPGRCFVSPALHEDVEHMPVLIHSPPQVVLRAVDLDEDLIKVPLVPRAQTVAA